MTLAMKQGLLPFSFGDESSALDRLRGACEEARRRLARIGVRFKYSAERNARCLDPRDWPAGNPDFHFSWQIGLGGCSCFCYAKGVQGEIEGLMRAVEYEETSRKGDEA